MFGLLIALIICKRKKNLAKYDVDPNAPMHIKAIAQGLSCYNNINRAVSFVKGNVVKKVIDEEGRNLIGQRSYGLLKGALHLGYRIATLQETPVTIVKKAVKFIPTIGQIILENYDKQNKTVKEKVQENSSAIQNIPNDNL